MKEEDVANFASLHEAAGLEDQQSPDLGCLKPSEHQGDYELNRDLVNDLLAQTRDMAL